MRVKRVFSRFSVIGAILASAVGSGCNILTPIAYAVEGPPKMPAVVTIPDRPTLVYVDDRANVMGRTALRQIAADKASEVLMVNEIVERTISPRDAMAIVRQETHDKPMAMDEIGRKVGAEQLIFVEVSQFMLTPDGYTPRPQAACYVRVIDVAGRTRMFPPPDSMEPGYLLQVKLREVPGELLNSPSGRRKLEEDLAQEMGEQLAKMFFEHEQTELGSRLGKR